MHAEPWPDHEYVVVQISDMHSCGKGKIGSYMRRITFPLSNLLPSFVAANDSTQT